MKKKQLLLGAHMSVARGYEQALIRGASIECTAIQLFTKSSRQWAAKPISNDQKNLFKKTLKELPSIKLVVAHASYLINIASSDETLAKKSITALIEELQRCHNLEIPYLVLHPGAAVKSTPHESLQIASKNLNTVFEEFKGNAVLLLENTAGQGSSIGSTFEELKTIYDGVTHKKKIGFCFDTCHAFVAGYDFSTPTTYEKMWDHFDAILDVKNLKVFHFNDSLKGIGSHVDRHAHIGKGKIGLEGFRLLMNDARFFDIPKILETPKASTHLNDDILNMTTLKGLLTESTKKHFSLIDR